MSSFSRPQTLAATHNLERFACGRASLDEFLKLHALDKQRAMLSRTYVVVDGENFVVAYYTLAHVAIGREEAPQKVGRGMPKDIPALLLARLAIDHRFQHQGLGRFLFADALLRTWAVMKDGAAPVRLFVVDARDEQAKEFYANFEILPSPQNPMRLFLHYKEIRKLFEAIPPDE